MPVILRPMASEGYELRPLDLDDAGILRITTLLRKVFPDAAHFTEEVLRWEYLENPDGPAVGTNAWIGDELAAHYVTIPLRATVLGREEKGLLSLNTATHPAHQGKGLFTKLAKATYARAAAEGYGFVVGVANANSTPGFTRKLGFQLVAPLLAMVGAGPLVPQPVPQVDYARTWHPEALRWRLAHPTYRYTLKPGKKLDLLMTGRSQAGARLLLGALPHGTLPKDALPLFDGSAPLRIWIGLDAGLRWSGRPWFNIPMRLRPSPLNLIFLDLTGKERKLDPARIRFQAIDFDTL